MEAEQVKPVPLGIQRIARTVTGQHALLLFLDGYPYVEFTARKSADFTSDLNAWKKNTFPSLRRSECRFFTLAPDGDLKELSLIRS